MTLQVARADALSVHHFGPDPISVGGIATVIRILAEHNIGGDHVHAFPTWRPEAPIDSARLTAASAVAIRRLPAGLVAHIHLSERGSFVREGAMLALARRRRLVTVATLHGASFLPFACRHPRLVAAVLARAHLLICLHEGDRECARALAPSVRCEIVPNPVVVDESAPPADQTEELVLFAGEIGLRKGADVLHRAWPLVAERRPAARCLMVGPITDFRPPATERLQVLPPVAPAEMPRLMRRARVVALPARAEGMPMTLTEAMSLGRPFVSTPVGGIPELGQAGGMLVGVDDEIELADRLTDLLADRVLARTLGERGRRFCIQTRSVEILDARLRELYRAAGELCGTCDAGG
jgi:glycosyltransferase involved in cell wall biosynthesis